jgi:hypothetical protein
VLQIRDDFIPDPDPGSYFKRKKGKFLKLLPKLLWRQGFGEWLFPLQSPFSTAGLPAALEAAATGGSTEESSSLILLL